MPILCAGDEGRPFFVGLVASAATATAALTTEAIAAVDGSVAAG